MRRQIFIAVGAAIALVILFSFVLIKPKLGQIKEVNVKVQEAERREKEIRLSLDRLRAARAAAPRTQAELAKFQLLLPSTPDLPTFIRQVQSAADADGVDLISIAPSPPAALGGPGSTATGVQVVSVNLQVVAGFFRLESFLSRLENLQRVVEVRSLGVSPQPDALTGETTLQSTITLTMYIVEPGARVPAVSRSPGATPSPSPSPGSAG